MYPLSNVETKGHFCSYFRGYKMENHSSLQIEYSIYNKEQGRSVTCYGVYCFRSDSTNNIDISL
jgi:hypothetical protein